MASQVLTNESYTIGWICALEIELAAAQGLLDDEHPDLPVAEKDSNAYILGRIAHHNVVIATLPTGRPGTSPAAIVAINLLRSFPNIRFGLMVGVGGGAPAKPHSDPQKDIRLGDVVVSSPHGKYILQYDFGKLLHEGSFINTGSLNHIPTVVGTALAKMRANARLKGYKFPAMLDSLIETYSEAGFDRPVNKDQLFIATYHHIDHEEDDCSRCEAEMTISRQTRKKPSIPSVHYGIIGSANQVLRDPSVRDRLRNDSDVLCVEMEAGGLMNDFPCVVIRGICDYCDSHKNKLWQPYAAAVAAAFSKELLHTLAPAVVAQQQTARELVKAVEELTQTAKTTQASINKIDQKIILDGLTYAKGATFDAFADVHELDAKCLRGTRLDLLRQIRAWVINLEDKAIFWLNGAAGTGKSTIARTVAEEFHTSQQLGASFFFKRGEGDRGGASKFFPTIARQLASFMPDLGLHIKTAIENNPDIAEKVLREQFERLILDPFDAMTQKPTSHILLVVDALDECEGDEDVKMIIALLSRPIAGKYFRVLLTSRPELPIRLGFSTLSTDSYQNLILQEIPADIVKHDISLYLKHKFDRIKLEHGNLPSEWPSQKNLHLLVDMAYPLFIFAATIYRFVADPMWQPHQQLEYLLQFKYIDGDEINRTYSPILARFLRGPQSRQAELINDFKTIVGPIVVVAEPLSIRSFASLLRIEQERISNRLLTLHSVLSIPPDDMEHVPIRMFHLSFANFLLEPNRKNTHQFWIDEQETHLRMAQRCLELLSTPNKLKQDLCGLIYPGTPRSEIDSSILRNALPEEVQYACKYWVFHVERCQNHIASLEDKIFAFLKQQFLQWFEAISILGWASNMIYLINNLSDIARHRLVLADMIYDARRFVLANSYIANIAPLQLYSSCIIFAPKYSIIKEHATLPHWLRTLPEVRETWPSAIQTLEGHEDRVKTIAWSPDKEILASGSGDNTVKLWNTASGHLLQTLHGHCAGIDSLAFSPVNGKLLASVSNDATVKIWDVVSGTLEQTFASTYSVEPSSVSSSDLVSTCSDSDENCSESSSISSSLSSTGYLAHHAIAFMPDGKSLVHASDDGNVKFWQVSSGQMQHMSIQQMKLTEKLTISADGKKIAFTSSDVVVNVWDIESKQLQHTFEESSEQIQALAFSPDVKILAIAERGHTIKLMNIASGELEHVLPVSAAGGLAISPSNRELAVFLINRSIGLWDITSGQLRQSFWGHTNYAFAMVFSQDGKSLVSCSDDQTIRLWDLHSEQHLQEENPEDSGHGILRIEFSPNSKLVVSGHRDGDIKVWSIGLGQLCLQQTLEGHPDYLVLNLKFSSDGELLASCGSDRLIKLWSVSLNGLESIRIFEGHVSEVIDATFSWNDKLIASCTLDDTIKIWDVDSGQCLHTSSVQDKKGLSYAEMFQQFEADLGDHQIEEQRIPPDIPEKDSVRFDPENHWLFINDKRLLWLPPDYRGEVAIRDEMIIVGLNTGHITFFEISFEKLSQAGLLNNQSTE